MDINCDMGEIPDLWYHGNHQDLLPFLTSVNISCGAHAGTPELILDTAKAAIGYKLKIGAHPSFPDKSNFGRKEMNMSSADLKETLFDQIIGLKNIVEKEGGILHHVKPHGALYNMAARDPEIAKLVLEVIKEIDDKLIIFCPSNSELEKAAELSGLAVWKEAFADRRYQKNGELVPRSKPGSIISNPVEALNQARGIVENGLVRTIDGAGVALEAKTICIHGDGKTAFDIAKKLNEHFG